MRKDLSCILQALDGHALVGFFSQVLHMMESVIRLFEILFFNEKHTLGSMTGSANGRFDCSFKVPFESAAILPTWIEMYDFPGTGCPYFVPNDAGYQCELCENSLCPWFVKFAFITASAPMASSSALVIFWNARCKPASSLIIIMSSNLSLWAALLSTIALAANADGPPDSSSFPYPEQPAERTFKPSYDFCVVGGGTAGLVMGNRLSESGMHTVVVFEARAAPTVMRTYSPPGGNQFGLNGSFKS